MTREDAFKKFTNSDDFNKQNDSEASRWLNYDKEVYQP